MRVIAKSKDGRYLDVEDPEFEQEIEIEGEPVCQYCFTVTGKNICDECKKALQEIYGGKK